MSAERVRMARRSIAEAAREAHGNGWMPATSGNVSVRVDERSAVISASGCAKGELTESDTVCVDLADSTLCHPGEPRPSAETAIHTALYRTTGCGAVLHTHSPYATAASVRLADDGWLLLDGYELVKGIGDTRGDHCSIPVFINHSDVGRIAAAVEAHMREPQPDAPSALLIAGHGLTTWAGSLAAARDVAEGVESLCQVVLLAGSVTSARIDLIRQEPTTPAPAEGMLQ